MPLNGKSRYVKLGQSVEQALPTSGRGAGNHLADLAFITAQEAVRPDIEKQINPAGAQSLYGRRRIGGVRGPATRQALTNLIQRRDARHARGNMVAETDTDDGFWTNAARLPQLRQRIVDCESGGARDLVLRRCRPAVRECKRSMSVAAKGGIARVKGPAERRFGFVEFPELPFPQLQLPSTIKAIFGGLAALPKARYEAGFPRANATRLSRIDAAEPA